MRITDTVSARILLKEKLAFVRKCQRMKQSVNDILRMLIKRFMEE